MAIHRSPPGKTIPELKNLRAKCFNRAEDILDTCDNEDRDLTAGGKRQYQSELDEIERLTKKLELKLKAEKQQIQGLQGMSGGDPHAGRISAASGATVRAFADTPAGREAAFSSGMFIRAALLGDERSRLWCRECPSGNRAWNEPAHAL